MSLVTALVYWVIIALWLAVLTTVCIAYLRNPRTFGTTRLLLAVLAIDTCRNIIENLYFGLYFGAQYGLFPGAIIGVLGQPQLLIIPKLINVVAAGAVLGILLWRWLPMASREKANAEDDIQKYADALTEEVEKQRHVFETSLDLILVTDRQGNLLRVSNSAAEILGYNVAEMVGRNASEFILPTDIARLRAHIKLFRKGEKMRNVESQHRHKNGRSVAISWSGVQSNDQQRLIFIGHDLTEQHKLEQELRQTQKMNAIGELTGGIAHDYNNLLTVILGNSEILAERLQGDPELYSIAQLNLEAAERSAVLTQRLLAFGRRQALEPKVTDVNKLLEGMRDLLHMTLGAHIKKQMIAAPDLWATKIDRNQLETAMVNLCVNARDAMPDGGKLVIETKNKILDQDYTELRADVQPGEYVEISVSDTGSGMTQNVMERVFEPFFTTKEVGKGTGLGLSMIYGFVKQSGGHTAIYSEPGNGTVVRVYLPRAEAASIVPTLEDMAQKPVSAGSGLILLVEDNPIVRPHTEKMLISLGYKVAVAMNAADAMKQIENGLEPRLMLTDIVMPGHMNGWQLAAEMKKKRPETEVIFTSGYTSETLATDQDLPNGANFIGKPFRRSELAEKIKEVLEKTKAPRKATRSMAG